MVEYVEANFQKPDDSEGEKNSRSKPGVKPSGGGGDGDTVMVTLQNFAAV